MLRLLQEDRFPAVWQPSVENEQLRQLLLHRCRLVRLRTRITNQLDSMGKNEGLLGSKSWSAERRRRIEALPLSGWYMQRRVDLLDLLDELEKRIEPLEKAVVEAAESHQQACLLMTHPGVGPIVSLVYVLTIGDWTRFARSRELASYLGLIPAEDSSADKRRFWVTSASRATRCCVGAGPSRLSGAQRVRSKLAPTISSFVAEQASRRRQGGHGRIN